MLLKKNIATSESGFIFNPSTGDSFAANPIAAHIITLLKNGMDVNAIKKDIAEKYDVTAAQIEKDWDDFVQQLRFANLLEN